MMEGGSVVSDRKETPRQKRSRHSEDDGVSAVEFSFIALLLFMMTFALIDMARYFYARSVAQNALAYAIKRAQTEFNTVVEFDQLTEASVDYQRFNAARGVILGEAEEKLSELQRAVRFYESRDMDDLAGGTRVQEPRQVAYLLPGKASIMKDPTNPQASAEMVQNQNLCRKSSAAHPIDQSGVEYYSSSSDWCSAGKYRVSESYKSLTKIYPLEMVVKARFRGIIARDWPITASAAGFLPDHTDGPVTSSNTPTPTPTNTPLSTPPVTPSATPTSPVTLTPTATPTGFVVPSATPTVRVTPSSTPTFSPTATGTSTSLPTRTPTPRPTNTSTPVPTNTFTPFPTATPTQTPSSTPTTPPPPPTPTPQLCPDAGVALRALNGFSERHDGRRFEFESKRLVYDEGRKLWYDNQGGSTWTCMKNPSFVPKRDGSFNLVFNFNWQRSNANRNNLAGRLNFGIRWMEHLATFQNVASACYICGLIRHDDGCFPPGVEIAVGDGTDTRKIEEIASGDLIWNPVRKKAARVLTVSEGPEKLPLVRIIAGGLTLRVSGEHPVLTGAGMKQARLVSVGDTVQNADLTVLTVERVEFEPAPAGLSVINFVLEREGHADDGILLADGVAVGDLMLQKNIATAR